MFYVFDDFGAKIGEFKTVTSIIKKTGITVHRFNNVVDSKKSDNGYFYSTTDSLWKGFEPIPVYIFNERGLIVQVTGTYESLYSRVKGVHSKEVIKEFFFDDDKRYLELKDYRYYKDVPDHVPDLFKRYSLLDDDGNITNYYKDLQSICKATGLSRQSVHYQTTKPNGFIRRNC